MLDLDSGEQQRKRRAETSFELDKIMKLFLSGAFKLTERTHNFGVNLICLAS